MIRRLSGLQFLLITQDAHAAISGKLAEHIGNSVFDSPMPKDRIVRAITLHDCGWPLHDDHPTLNPAGEPLDVFETPRPIALKVWAASAEQAAKQDDYAGLLASLHALALSAMAVPKGSPELADATNRFALNKFQHRQIELQEELRKKLKMRTDLPLNQGLALETDDPAEQSLLFHFRLLQAMDQLSLAICCTKPPNAQIRSVLARPNGRGMALRVRKLNDRDLHVSPWPFDVERITLKIPYRAVTNKPFANESAFQKAYAAAPEEHFTAVVQASP